MDELLFTLIYMVIISLMQLIEHVLENFLHVRTLTHRNKGSKLKLILKPVVD